MKKIFPFVLLLSFLVASCNNELDLTADFKDIPVVYGVLSQQDTAHYIRVEKAFIDDEINAFLLAEDPANLYYEDLEVRLVRLSDGTSYPMTRVNGTDEGYPRAEGGIFVTDPNYLYKVKESIVDLLSGEEIKLEIDRGQGIDLVTATATIIRPMELKRPIPPTGPMTGNLFDIQIGRSATLEVAGGSEAKIYDAIVTLHFYETVAGSARVAKEVKWEFARNYDNAGDNRFIIETEGTSFYTTISSKLEANTSTIREFRKLSIDITAGGRGLKEYIDLTSANTGITSAQEIPTYTNLSDGLGIFSSKYSLHVDSIGLSDPGREDLFNSELTRDLNFE